MDLAYFILLTSILIFIHESGHFVFAKVFGVKVITFSIGFGPKILRLRGKETEYCVGLLPFGGFVKMLEEAKGTEPIPPEDKRRTFESQALWKRVMIVLAGPAMNVVFPVALYTSVYLEDRVFPAPTVGTVLSGRPAEGKLVPGDRVISVEGQEVETFPDIQRAVAKKAGVPLRFVVERDERRVDVQITPVDEIEERELDMVEHVGRIGIGPHFPASVIGVPRADSPAYRAGLRSFDRIVAVNGRKVERFVELAELLSKNRGDAVVVSYLRPVPVSALGGLCDIGVMEAGAVTLTPNQRDTAPPGEDADTRARDMLERTGIEGAGMYVAFVPEGSSEWKAGLRAGDRITELDGQEQRDWHAMEAELIRGANRSHELSWTRDGLPMAGVFQLRKEQWNDEYAQHYERYVFRTTHWVPHAKGAMVDNPNLVTSAVRRAVEETVDVVKFITVGFVRILQGRVSLASVSGPITIYDVAGRAGAKGTTYFVWAMAVISINLGLVNLLPIPVLDGGHLVFLALEAIKKRPLSLRVREVSSLVGMSVLFLLMLVAFKNDVERRWDVILGQIREIFG